MGAEAPAASKKAKRPKVDAKSLADDVRQFASTLGLASGAAAGGNDDDAFADFAPSKAKKSIAADGGHPNKRQRLNEDGGDGSAAPGRKQPPAQKKAAVKVTDAKQPKDNKKQEQRGRKGQDGPRGGDDDELGGDEHGGAKGREGGSSDPLKARDWNFGVGPRPGGSRLR